MDRMPVMLFLAAFTAGAHASEPVTPADAPVVVYQADAVYQDIRSNVEMAITGRGMVISNVLHISEMLERTAADTGLDKKLYEVAESFEFCSIAMSYKMSSAHPGNMASCPLTISLYVTPDAPDTVNLAYRRPRFLGDAAEAEAALTALLDGIAREALE